MYDIILTPHARREFDKLSSTDRERVEGAIAHLGVNPRLAGVKKLFGAIYRIRAGDWRIIYVISDKNHQVVVVKIARRSEDTYNGVKDLF